jgi:hypothetical protein
MDCQDATGQRPKLSPEFKVDWTKIATVDQAHAAFDNFTLVLRGREQTVANYVIEIEGKLFQCANDAAWLREWNSATRLSEAPRQPSDEVSPK